MRRFEPMLFAALLLMGIVLASGMPQATAEGAPINITFEFMPAQAHYAPGEDFVINITGINTMPSGDFVYDDLAYKEKVMNISVHFGWMAPSEFAWKNVSEESSWLDPDGLGAERYSMNITVPSTASEQTYSYYFRIVYFSHTPWGNLTNVWGTDLTYHDFVVSSASASEEAIDYAPYLALAAVVVAVGALGAVLYYRKDGGRGVREAASASGIEGAAAGEPPTAYPVIHATPGEHFPIERGLLYLVKEKRPNIAFSMFNEAIKHGAKGMLVVREHPNRLKQLHEFEAAKILWLTRRVGVDHIDPTRLSLLTIEMSKFVEATPKSVILLEGLEYVITQNDFDSVLRFINHLHDFVLGHDCAVVIVIDPRVLNTRELALLERSARIVEPAEPIEPRNGKLSEEIEA